MKFYRLKCFGLQDVMNTLCDNNSLVPKPLNQL